MFAKVNICTELLPEELDTYLENGWFRMGQSVFTTNFLTFKNNYFSAVWLRVDLENYSHDPAFVKLKKQNESFSFKIQQSHVTPEKEALFAKYKQSVIFDASESIEQLLFGRSSIQDSVFNTYEINLYDSNKLIACGYFDIGKTTAAGISSFYDPDYKKKSLGKYLIYLKLEYCKENNLKHFYPGYFVPGYPAFDYKLSIGASGLRFFSVKSAEWLPVSKFSAKYNLIDIMQQKLSILLQSLVQENISCKFHYYDFFQANMVSELTKFELFDFPVFLLCLNLTKELINPLIVFDIFDDNYKLIQCRSVWKTAEPSFNPDIYSAHLLKEEYIIHKTSDTDNMVSFLTSGN